MPIKRSPLKSRTSRVRAKRPGTRRVSVLRDPAYLEWLREQKCAVCVAENKHKGMTDWGANYYAGRSTDAAHTSNNGASSKGPDSGCLPLCRVHHREQHRIGVPDFEAKYRISLKAEAAVFYAAFCLTKEELQ